MKKLQYCVYVLYSQKDNKLHIQKVAFLVAIFLKKFIWVSLIILFSLFVTGCVSEEEYYSCESEKEELQENIDALEDEKSDLEFERDELESRITELEDELSDCEYHCY